MEVAEKKIFVLVGSRAGMRSNTRELCTKFIAAVGKKWPGSRYLLRVEILTADEWNIGACRSCSSCFQRGNCPSDRLDNMPEIKRKLLECDGLILASPVYAGTVSGDMKILIDRLSGWLHTMPLIGKTAAVFSTADSNHGNAVIDYLSEMVEMMGASLTAAHNVFTGRGPVLLTEDEKLEQLLLKSAEAFVSGIMGKPPVSERQEEHFLVQSRLYSNLLSLRDIFSDLCFAEAYIWEEQGYCQYDSISQIIEERRKADGEMVEMLSGA